METFVSSFLQQIQTGQFTELPGQIYLILAILAIVEGPLTTLTGAAFASTGALNPTLVFLSVAGGNLTGDSFWYLLGRFGKTSWFATYGDRIGIHSKQFDKLEKKIVKHSSKALLITKATSTFIIPTLITSGLTRTPWRRWFPPVLAGEILWSGSLVLAGYLTAKTIPQIVHRIQVLPILVISSIVIVWAVRRFWK